jgi:cytoskeletal protein CcmA (bactofilin family)
LAWKLSKRHHSHDSGVWAGFLDKAVRLEGTIEIDGTFRLEGNVKGTIISSQTLMLGDGAHVEGQIEGNHVMISGRFDGVIFAKGRVEIQPKGIVTGEIHTPCLVIEPGGIFDGQCHMLAASEAAKPLTIPIRTVQKA